MSKAIAFLGFFAMSGFAMAADMPHGTCLYENRAYTQGTTCSTACNDQTSTCNTVICKADGGWIHSSCSGSLCAPSCNQVGAAQ
jgi:hypothetical protein